MNLSTPRPVADTGAAPDWDRVRLDFPLLMREVHGKPLVYFDNANTGQKPVQVIGAVDEFYRRYNANVSRAVHALGTEATDAYEGARNKLARFLNVRASELVLCSGTTFAINLVAYSWRCRGRRPAMSSWSRAWSTMPTSCRGSWSPSAPGRPSAWPRSPRTAHWTWTRCARP